MAELRVKGLSCPNCAKSLEQQIQKLEYGETATLSYNSGKLTLDSRVPLNKVKKILKSDGASIVASGVQKANSEAHGHEHDQCCSHDHSHEHGLEHGHDHAAHEHDTHEHGHAHEHEGGGWFRNLVIASAVIYAAALILEGRIGDPILIGMFLAATAISGYTTFIRGIKKLVALRFDMDTLMTIALIGAISIGEWKEATLVAILFGLNELLEGMGMERARRSMESLLQVAPKEALLVEGDVERTVPIASLQAGAIVRVKPGGKIPSDGIVIKGKSSVNEAAITGESLPVEKAPGEDVFGGSINNEGVLEIRIAKAYEDSSLAKILHLVQEAQETKTPTEQFINKFSRYYTPLIMIISVLVIFIPPLFFGGEWSHWLYQGLAVLIVGCPCALILSSPIAIVAGITRSARNGILIKGGVHLEQLGKIDILAFDKTGTLTKGQPHVEEVAVYDEARLFAIAGAIEQSSSHPLAKAVMKEVDKRGGATLQADEIETLSGQGIRAVIEGAAYWLGNEKSMSHLNIPSEIRNRINEWKERGLTLVLVADDSRLLGMFGIADEIREESRHVIAALHRSGIRQTVMLTGDHAATAEKVAAEVGVTTACSNLLPEDKVAKVKALAGQGHVAMIGDGINDAPALASANLGIAMGKGTDSAIETADIVLMQDHLGKLPEAIITARRVNRIIRFNIIISLGLKLFALLLTIPGLLTLWIAILSDMGATIFVTLVSLTVLIDGKKARQLR